MDITITVPDERYINAAAQNFVPSDQDTQIIIDIKKKNYAIQRMVDYANELMDSYEINTARDQAAADAINIVSKEEKATSSSIKAV